MHFRIAFLTTFATFPLPIIIHLSLPSSLSLSSPLGYRVFAVDLLGFGGSDKVKEGVEYELELWRDLLVDFMEVRRRGRAGDLMGVLYKSLCFRAKVALGIS